MDRPLLLSKVHTVVSCDDEEQVFRNVDLLCVDGRISEIAAAGSTRAPQNAEIIDAQNLIVYPGLINTHHHFFQSLVRNQLALDWSTLTLVQWLERVYKVFTLINEDCIYHASRVSLAELAKSGCTTAFDHQYCFNRHAGSRLVDRQFEAATEVGLRLVVGRGTNTLPSSEGSTMPDEMVETTSIFLRDCERLVDSYHDPEPFSMRALVLAPCQPVNCLEETFLEALVFARAKKLRLHTHLCEGENALMQERWGQRSLDWCEDRDIVGADIWFAHGWEMTEAELQRMGQTGTGLAHCPAAMCLVGDGITNLAAANAFGVPIGFGVDGQASNDNSNLLECIRLAYLLQCLGAKDFTHPLPQPQQFLRFATRGGAELLGRPELGQLRVGAAADFFAVDSRRADFAATLHDPTLIPVKVGIPSPVDLTVAAGEVIWRDGAFTRIDEHEVTAAANTVYNSVILGSKVLATSRVALG
ncbi:MAG: amidohydrolase [Pseudomonadota bacterium]